MSHYFFNSFALKDRVDLSSLSEFPLSAAIDVHQFLPSDNDTKLLRNAYFTLISRYINV